MGLTGIAILLTGVVQSALKKLSLFHHHTLVHYLLLIILPFFFSRNPIPRSIKFLYVLLSLAFEVWVIYYMFASEHGVLGGPCSESMMVVTSSKDFDWHDIKWVFAGTTAVTAGQLVYMLFGPMLRVSARLLKIWENCRHVVLRRWRDSRCIGWLRSAVLGWLEIWGHCHCNVWLVLQWAVLAVGVILWAIFVTFTESLIAANQVEDEEQEWSFGQMLSVSMLLAPAFDCIRVMIGNWRTRGRQEDEVAPEDGGAPQGRDAPQNGDSSQNEGGQQEDVIELQTTFIDMA